MANPNLSDASRSGTAAAVASKRAGRLDARSWRDVERALKLGKKHDAFSVEVHGVRTVFKCARTNPVDSSGSGSRDKPANRWQVAPTSASVTHTTQLPNSAQRRSARRMQDYIQSKKGSGSTSGPGPASSVEPPHREPARVETDVRRGADAMETDEEGRRGEKRVASETPASAKTTALLQHAEQRAHSQVEPTGRRGRGLEPLSSEEKRRMNAARAQSDRRERQRPTN